SAKQRTRSGAACLPEFARSKLDVPACNVLRSASVANRSSHLPLDVRRDHSHTVSALGVVSGLLHHLGLVPAFGHEAAAPHLRVNISALQLLRHVVPPYTKSPSLQSSRTDAPEPKVFLDTSRQALLTVSPNSSLRQVFSLD